MNKPTICPRCNEAEYLKKINTYWTEHFYEGWACEYCLQEIDRAIFPEAFIVYETIDDSVLWVVSQQNNGSGKWFVHPNIRNNEYRNIRSHVVSAFETEEEAKKLAERLNKATGQIIKNIININLLPQK